MNTELSDEAKSALVNVGTNRQGAVVSNVAVSVEAELYLAGLIGPERGLTRRGTIVRERLVRAALDSAFS